MLKFNDILDSNNFKTSNVENLNINEHSNNNLDNNNLISNNFNNRVESSYTNLKIMNINKNNLNNINIININKEENILVNENAVKKKEKNLNTLFNNINGEIINNKIILNQKNNYSNNGNSHFNRRNIYKLLMYHIFRCFLSKNKKLDYKKNIINLKTFQKKMDIYNYLLLLKKLDLLSALSKKFQLQNNYHLTNSMN